MTAPMDPTTDEGATAVVLYLSTVATRSILAAHIQECQTADLHQLLAEVSGLTLVLAWDIATAAPEWMTATHRALQSRERALVGDAGAAESRATIAALLQRFPIASVDDSAEVGDDE